MNIPATPAERNAIMAEFLNPDYILVQPRVLYRLDGLNRYYWCVNPDGSISFFRSATTVIGASLPTSKHLIAWMVAQGANYIEKRDTAADYGTEMGRQIGEFIKAQYIDLGEYVEEVLETEEEDEREDKDAPVEGKMKKDLLAFNQWVRDYEVVVIGIEIMLGSETMGYAGAIDIVVKMNAKLYDKTPPEKRERIIAVIDLKSGRKGFWDSHELQLHLYWKLWDEWMAKDGMEHLKAQAVYNWAPSAWKKAPSYKLKNQTNSRFGKNLDHRIAIAQDLVPDKPGQRAYIKGTLKLGGDPTANYGKVPIEEWLRQTYPQRFEDVEPTPTLAFR